MEAALTSNQPDARQTFELIAADPTALKALLGTLQQTHDTQSQETRVALQALENIIYKLLDGKQIQLASPDNILTIDEAADELILSADNIQGLIKAGKLLAFDFQGECKLFAPSVTAYKEQLYQERERLLAEMMADAQEMGFYK